MNNQQDDYGFDHPDRMPSLLTVFAPVRHDQMKRIIEDSLGEIECDAMLSKIAPSLLRIPFEPQYDTIDYSIVRTIPQKSTQAAAR